MGCPTYTAPIRDRDPDFRGVIYDWDFFRRTSKNYPAQRFRLYRGVCPSWDNEARRPGRGTVFLGNTPERYGEWLQNAAVDTISRFTDPSERLVFINAWNEWAEGAYLEPDRRNGYAYLAATRAALEAVSWPNRARGRVVLVGHDAHRHGAQFLLLHLIWEMTRHIGVEVECVLLRGGPLVDEYRTAAPLHLLAGADPAGLAAKSLAADLKTRGFTVAIANTTVCGLFARTLTEAGFAVVSLVHEQSTVIDTYEGRGLLKEAAALAAACNHIVFPSSIVADEFRQRNNVDPARAVVRPQGLYKRSRLRTPGDVEKAKQKVRSEFGWSTSRRLVLGVGFGDRRKGVDLFANVAAYVLTREQNAAFLWVGDLDEATGHGVAAWHGKSTFAQQVAFTGFRSDLDVVYAAADLFILPSREDPFPSVLLGAFDAGLPAVAFAGVGGFDGLFATGEVGALVDAFDITAFGDAVLQLLHDDALRQRKGAAAARLIQREYLFSRYACDLLRIAGVPTRTVSVIVPNYNYCRYLDARLRSVATQTHSPFEVIVIDDASSDGSAEWLSENLSRICPDAELIINAANSGSVFRQWYNGCRRATGEFVWIAEADDLADPEFLDAVLRGFDDPDVVLSYCQSRQVTPDGAILSNDYLDYVADISPDKWRSDHIVDGLDEIRHALAVKNTIPNVSAVVFRRSALLEALEANLAELDRLRVAGDWFVYVDVIRKGKVAFLSRALNTHRRHTDSVTFGTAKMTHLREVITMQCKVRDHFAPPSETTASAAAYREVLYRQFDLATPEAANAADHPDLKELVKQAER
jgi:glycosyltransferase involved in cell wall biosynthesis